MSVVLKASFSFVVEGLMPLVAPDEIYGAEVHHEGNPARSLWAASDLAPYRAQADVVLTGHALVPEESATVRLAVYRDHALIDKSLDVVPSGDFEGRGRVPLMYEHAPGGPEWDDNPVGTSLPSIVDSSDPRRPVGFGPIAATWPLRARRRGHLTPQALTAAIATLPDDLDWRYFSSAPADQVTDYLHGDEWIVLENLVAGHPLVRMRLPSAHAEAQVFGLGPGPGPAVAMHADHLHIDVDRARCSVTWRGSFDVGSEEAMRRVVVRVGVAVPGQPIAWPPFPPPLRAQILVPLTAPPTSARLTLPTIAAIEPAPGPSPTKMTLQIEDEPTSPPILPFVHAAIPRQRPPAPARALAPENPLEMTMTIADDEPDQVVASSRALPFVPPPSMLSAAPAAPLLVSSHAHDQTAIIDDDDDDEPEETTVPMAQAFRRGRLDTSRPSQGIPGAPWSGVPAAPVPRPEPEYNDKTASVHRDQVFARLDPARALKRPPPPSVPVISAPPPSVPVIPDAPPPSVPVIPDAPPVHEVVEAKAAIPWSVPDAPKVEMPPPPPKAPATPVVQNALYNRFAAKKK